MVTVAVALSGFQRDGYKQKVHIERISNNNYFVLYYSLSSTLIFADIMLENIQSYDVFIDFLRNIMKSVLCCSMYVLHGICWRISNFKRHKQKPCDMNAMVWYTACCWQWKCIVSQAAFRRCTIKKKSSSSSSYSSEPENILLSNALDVLRHCSGWVCLCAAR